jgi:DeoR family transcriptional regulator of aga operon
MNRTERSNRILGVLAERGNVDVEELVTELAVSPATVRRDLDALAEKELLVRTHGGATRGGVAYDLPQRYRLGDDAAKRAVAEKAVALVARGMTVGLTGGTTTGIIAQLLGMRPDLRSDNGRPSLTVVTNSVNIASTLAVRPHIKVVVSGGVMHPASYELVGPWAVQTLGGLSCDVAFIGVDGMTPERGFTVHEEDEAELNALMAARAHSAWVVTDSTKAGHVAFAALPEVEGIGLITDRGLPDADRLAWEARGVTVALA